MSHSDPISSLNKILDLDHDHQIECIKMYASNSNFRSADVEELKIEGNPYRRPVRPEDLEFIDYSHPLTHETALQLSALASHRMLLNIYETDFLLLPEKKDTETLDACKKFYSNRNRALGELVRPFLEFHVFGLLSDAVDKEKKWTSSSLRDYFYSAHEECDRAEIKLRETILSSKVQKTSAVFLLIQFAGSFASRSAACARIGAAPAGGSRLDIDFRFLPSQDGDVDAIRDMAGACGIVADPHSHWQFFLSTSLALTNYLHFVCRDYGNLFKALGALYYYIIRLNSFRRIQGESLRDLFGSEFDTKYFDKNPKYLDDGESLFSSMIETVVKKYGDFALKYLAAGFSEMRYQQEISDDDFIEQITWLTQIERYRVLAERLQKKICTEKIEVDLETFVEPRDLCSTTHVHNDHRLVVIEEGSMLFWGNIGMKERFDPGDKILIPRYRLHGSTVISEECTYHQPIIPHGWIEEAEAEL